MPSPARSCPHCGSRLKKWRVPQGATWNVEHFLVCFNDDCSYYRDGWTWMMEQFGQKASYRYALDPSNDTCMPIPVWSDSAARQMIEDDEDGES